MGLPHVSLCRFLGPLLYIYKIVFYIYFFKLLISIVKIDTK